jgi:sialate O-acetylesterase
MRRTVEVFFCVMLCCTALMADVKLAGVFSDGMVLQREMPVPVWGWAEAGEKVIVSFGGQNKEVVADDAGAWKVSLDPMEASAENRELRVGKVIVKNVLVGEVWFCTGQSNMEWSLARTDGKNIKWEYPNIRLMTTPKKASGVPVKDLDLNWVSCDHPQMGFSSVGFHYGVRLHRELGVPIGLINSAWGGTRIEPWISPEGFELAKELHPEMDKLAKEVALLDPSLDVYKDKVNEFMNSHSENYEIWKKKALVSLEEGRYVPDFPVMPNFQPSAHHQQPCRIFFYRVHPIVPFAMRGVIWYQGESNGSEGVTYLKKKVALIEGWRKIWSQPLSFYFVQLADFKGISKNPGQGDGWARLREAQLQTLEAVEDTGMAVICDIGNARDIHPKNKSDVGNRLALWAMAKNYGKKDLVYSGPLYKGHKIDGDKVFLDFKHLGGGLVVGLKEGQKPTQVIEDGTLMGFAVAGEDKVFHLAEAVIEGDQVVVRSEKVSAPVALRFGFCQNPRGINLYNREGLLASPFRTDSW